MSLNKRRSRIERQMERAISKVTLLVQAIKLLNPADKKRLIEYYKNERKSAIDDLFYLIEKNIYQVNKDVKR